MALIGYPYEPTRDDLFLYEDTNVSWSDGSAVIKRPYAWNPSSPLYGYRKSLAGMSARYRTFSSTPVSIPAWALAANDIDKPVSKPAFFNSWPPSICMLNSKFALMCRHCYAVAPAVRNASSFFVPQLYASGSYIEAVFNTRFIDENNSFTNLAATALMTPYTTDPAYPNLNAGVGWDVGISEIATGSEVSVNPVVIADPTSMVPDSPAWVIDGSDKILRARYKLAWTGMPYEHYWFETTYPDGTPWVGDLATQQLEMEYTHDSGSKVFVEISPPTSWSAGDGVLGLVPFHLVSVGTFYPGYTRQSRVIVPQTNLGDGYSLQASPTGLIAQNYSRSWIPEYLAHRGHPMQVSYARRLDIAATASGTAESDILGKAAAIVQTIL